MNPRGIAGRIAAATVVVVAIALAVVAVGVLRVGAADPSMSSKRHQPIAGSVA